MHAAAAAAAAAGQQSESARPVQDRAERMAVAEQLHYKICALLLMLNPGQPAEAVEQMRVHMSAYKRVPVHPGGVVGLPRAALPAHWQWVARQYQAFAELLAGRVSWVGRCRLTGVMPVLKAPIVSAFEIEYHKLLPTYGFNFNVRRYS